MNNIQLKKSGLNKAAYEISETWTPRYVPKTFFDIIEVESAPGFTDVNISVSNQNILSCLTVNS